MFICNIYIDSFAISDGASFCLAWFLCGKEKQEGLDGSPMCIF